MNSKITKFTTAAVLVIAVVLSIVFLDKSATSAYAIEDTIRALEKMQINAIKMSGIGVGIGDNGKEAEYEYTIWAKPNEDRTCSKEVRYEVPGQSIIVAGYFGKTYRYVYCQNTVTIENGNYFEISPWLNSKFFSKVKKYAKNWQITYGKDEQTGKESIFATGVHPCDEKSWWIEFDSQSRLPIRLKQWENANFQGKPQFNFTDIEYNPVLSEGIFEFEIPEGAKILEALPPMLDYLDDPNCGVVIDVDLDDSQAAINVVKDYWQAMIDGNWQLLAQLRPIYNQQKWAFKYKKNDCWPQDVIAIGTPYISGKCDIGIIVPCVIKYAEDDVREIDLIVAFRDFEGQRSCVIAGICGDTGDF